MPYLSLTTATTTEGSVTSQMMVIVVMMYPESFYYFGHSSTTTVSHSVRHSDLIVGAVVPAVVLGRCDIIVGAAARDAHDSSQCRRRRKTDGGRTRGWARLSHFAEFTKS